MKNILVVNVNWLGDCIFSSPVFKALRDNFPQAKISCLAVPRVKEVLECIPQIDRIIIYDEKGAHRSWWAKWTFSQELKKENFDTAIILRPSWSRSLLLAAAKIPQRIGYAKNNRKAFLTQAIAEPTGSLHRSDYYLKVLEASGIKVKSRQTYLQCDPKAIEETDRILKEAGVHEKESFMVINPGGNWLLKRWPIANYIALIREIEQSHPEKIVLTGSPGDEELTRLIQKEIKSPKLVSLAGKTNLKQLMAVLKRASFMISNDSGPLHIANSVGTKVIGIFGPTRAEVTAPRGGGEVYLLQKEIGCNLVPCYYLDCPSNLCMQAVKVKDVLNAVRQIKN